MVILITGASNDNSDYLDASDKLDTSNYSIITVFYSLCESKKSKSPPNDIQIYEEFLNLSTAFIRNSISKLFEKKFTFILI